MGEKLEAQRGKGLPCDGQNQAVNLGCVTVSLVSASYLAQTHCVSFYSGGNLSCLCLFWTQYRINVCGTFVKELRSSQSNSLV